MAIESDGELQSKFSTSWALLLLIDQSLFQRTPAKRLGNLADVEDSFLNLKNAIQFTEDGHPNKPTYFGNLGITRLARYERLGELHDVDESVMNCEKAVELMADGHPNKPACISKLGTSQLMRYKYLGELMDLQDVISHNICASSASGSRKISYFLSQTCEQQHYLY
jgi:hypothetical protein